MAGKCSAAPPDGHLSIFVQARTCLQKKHRRQHRAFCIQQQERQARCPGEEQGHEQCGLQHATSDAQAFRRVPLAQTTNSIVAHPVHLSDSSDGSVCDAAAASGYGDARDLHINQLPGSVLARILKDFLPNGTFTNAATPPDKLARYGTVFSPNTAPMSALGHEHSGRFKSLCTNVQPGCASLQDPHYLAWHGYREQTHRIVELATVCKHWRHVIRRESLIEHIAYSAKSAASLCADHSVPGDEAAVAALWDRFRRQALEEPVCLPSSTAHALHFQDTSHPPFDACSPGAPPCLADINRRAAGVLVRGIIQLDVCARAPGSSALSLVANAAVHQSAPAEFATSKCVAGMDAIVAATAINVPAMDPDACCLHGLQRTLQLRLLREHAQTSRLHMFAFLGHAAQLTVLTLMHSRLDTAGAEQLGQLHSLKQLRVFHCCVPHGSLKSWSGLSCLTHLQLDACAADGGNAKSVVPVDIEPLASLQSLQSVSICSTPTAPSVYDIAARLAALTCLSTRAMRPASACQLPPKQATLFSEDSDSAQQLQHCAALQQLSIGPGKPGTPAELRLCAQLTALRSLHVPCVRAPVLQAISELQLTELSMRNLQDMPVTALAHISQLTALEVLELHETRRFAACDLHILTPCQSLRHLQVTSPQFAQELFPMFDGDQVEHNDRSAPLQAQSSAWDPSTAAALAMAPLSCLCLNVAGAMPSTAVLEALCQATTLSALFLCPVASDISFEPLKRLPHLNSLWLHSGAQKLPASNDLLQPLGSLQQLSAIEARTFTRIPRAFAKSLRSATSLRSVCLEGHAPCASHILEHFAEMPRLHELALRSMVQMDPLHVRLLQHCADLECLHFSLSAVDSAVAAEIGQLRTLRFLSIVGAMKGATMSFTNSCMRHLRGLAGLQELDLSGNLKLHCEDVSDACRAAQDKPWEEAVVVLAAALPRCGPLHHLLGLRRLQKCMLRGTSIKPSACELVQQVMGLRQGVMWASGDMK